MVFLSKKKKKKAHFFLSSLVGCTDLIAVHGLSLGAANAGYTVVAVHGFPCGAHALECFAVLVVAQGLS